MNGIFGTFLAICHKIFNVLHFLVRQQINCKFDPFQVGTLYLAHVGQFLESTIQMVYFGPFGYAQEEHVEEGRLLHLVAFMGRPTQKMLNSILFNFLVGTIIIVYFSLFCRAQLMR